MDKSFQTPPIPEEPGAYTLQVLRKDDGRLEAVWVQPPHFIQRLDAVGRVISQAVDQNLE